MTAPDCVASKYVLNLAASKRLKGADDMRDMVATRMTSAQIAEAQSPASTRAFMAGLPFARHWKGSNVACEMPNSPVISVVCSNDSIAAEVPLSELEH
jgi:hypothetical protein